MLCTCLFCANYHVHASFERLERKCKEHNSKENVQHDSSIKMISLIDNLFKAGTSFPFEIVVSGLLFSLFCSLLKEQVWQIIQNSCEGVRDHTALNANHCWYFAISSMEKRMPQ